MFLLAYLSAPAWSATPLSLSVTGSASDGRPVVSGVTNLPDGAELLVSVSRSESKYNAQDKVTVAQGRFNSAKFSAGGAALPPGRYVVELVGPLTAVQPRARAALGDNYANFSGPLLKRTPYGTTVRYSSSFVVPGQTSAAGDARARAQAEIDRKAWWSKACADLPGLAERVSRAQMTPEQRKAAVRSCLADAK